MFPTEILWEIMRHLDFCSSKNIAKAFGLSDWDCYIYHSYAFPDPKLDIIDYYHTIYLNMSSIMLNRSDHYFAALMKNSSVRKLNDLMIFFLCCGFGYVPEIDALLRIGKINPGEWSGFGIRMASQSGHVKAVELLLKDKRVDPSKENQYALQKAVYHGHFGVVKVLLEDERVDPSVWNNYLIVEVCKNGETDLLRALLDDPRVDPSDRQNDAFNMAAKYGHSEIIKLLLNDKRVNPNFRRNVGLEFACYFGHYEVVQLLLNDPRFQTIQKNKENILNQTVKNMNQKSQINFL